MSERNAESGTRLNSASGELRLPKCMGAKNNWSSIEAGLQDVVAADVVDVTAGDDSQSAVSVANRELAHSVDEEQLTRNGGLGPAGKWDVFTDEEIGHFVKALGMARGENDEPGAAFKGIEKKLLFRGMGAADGDDGLREVEGFGDGLGLKVEFEVARDLEAGWIGNEGQEALVMVLVLDEEVVEEGKEFFGKAGEGEKTGGGSLGHFAAH
jgi:hypothetical protein